MINRYITSTVSALCIAATLWLGCQQAPTVSSQHTIEPTATQSLRDVPVPSGLDPKAVLLHQDKALQRARLPLSQIIALLPRPAYLPFRSDETSTTNDVSDDDSPTATDNEHKDPVQEPPVAAQRSYMAGRIAMREGKNFDAIRNLQAALRLTPNTAPVLRLLGGIYVQSGNRVRGGVYLEKAVKVDPNDFDSLLLLGRLAGEQGRWSDAIATLDYAAAQPGIEADPARRPLVQYFLGQALSHEHYDAAAIDQLAGYLDRPLRFDRTTQMVRQLFLLNRQRGSIWQTVGDAYNRLNQPAKALNAYQQAVAAESNISSGLTYRIVYTSLRMGELRLASQAVLDYMKTAGADTASVSLAEYLGQQGVDQPRLAGILRQIYESGDRPVSLALAIARLLDAQDVHDFLTAHLEAKPADRSVFELLVNHELSADPPDVSNIRRLLLTTTAIVNRLPTAAEEYTAMVTSAAGDPRLVLDAIDTMGEDERNDPIIQYIAGGVLAGMDRYEGAIARFEQAIAAAPDLLAPRVELARLLIDRGESQRAGELLDSLAQHADLRVMKLKMRLLLDTGEPVKAIRFLDEMIALHPVLVVDLVVEKAKLQLAVGNASAAQQTLLDALGATPRAERIYEQLLWMYNTNRIPDAREHYQSLVRQMLSVIPHSRIARTERARLLLAADRFDQAEPLIKTLLQEDPDDLKPLGAMLLLLARTDRQDQAQTLIADRLAKMPNDYNLLSVALRFYRSIGDRTKTVDAAHRLVVGLLDRSPRDLELLNHLIEILVDADEPAKVKTLLDQHLEAQPDDRDLLLLVRRHAELTSDADRLFETTERLLLLADPSAQQSQSLAFLYIEHDKPQEAIDVIIKQLEQQPDQRTSIMLNLLSRALVMIDQPDQADHHFGQMVERLPDHTADIKFEWAMNLERRGNRQRAEKLLLEVLDMDPDHPLASNMLGYAWADEGRNLQRAEELIRVAVDSDPNSAAYLDSLGWVLYKRGQFDDAVTWLQRATVAPGGEYPVILEHLGDALYRTDNRARALTTWRKAQATLDDADPTQDPDLKGIEDRLKEKTAALEADEDPSVADAPGWRPDAPQTGNDETHAENRDDKDQPNTLEDLQPNADEVADLKPQNHDEELSEAPVLMPHQDP